MPDRVAEHLPRDVIVHALLAVIIRDQQVVRLTVMLPGHSMPVRKAKAMAVRLSRKTRVTEAIVDVRSDVWLNRVLHAATKFL